MTKIEYINEFTEKHNIYFDRFVDPDEEVLKFRDGSFFELNDIIYDIGKDLPTWAAQEYQREGLEGIVTQSYPQWYEQRKARINGKV